MKRLLKKASSDLISSTSEDVLIAARRKIEFAWDAGSLLLTGRIFCGWVAGADGKKKNRQRKPLPEARPDMGCQPRFRPCGMKPPGLYVGVANERLVQGLVVAIPLDIHFRPARIETSKRSPLDPRRGLSLAAQAVVEWRHR